ncbi:hypothetical protein HMPREF0673_01276 [Leyella stercorea DSM 18206]|uniref:Uncharacterized protein n=1 Tax=Leyella stercorea DSM 18206 TaxID=1002367 RepID=G6AXC2_9BACT|nr:hypothetical protein HMPREF0673_01276 [Leyella stercorea DSM 18206]
MTKHADATQKMLMVATIVGSRHIAHRTDGESEVGRVANKLYGRGEQSQQAHTHRAKNERNEFVAHQPDKDTEHLNTTKQAGVLQYM